MPTKCTSASWTARARNWSTATSRITTSPTSSNSSIDRFPSVKDFLSYARLVKGTVASAGKIKGLRGAKLGNPYLRWAFGEAAVIAKRDHYQLKPLAQRLEAKMNGNKFKANTVIAIKLARAAFFMLKNKTVFDPDRLTAALAKN